MWHRRPRRCNPCGMPGRLGETHRRGRRCHMVLIHVLSPGRGVRNGVIGGFLRPFRGCKKKNKGGGAGLCLPRAHALGYHLTPLPGLQTQSSALVLRFHRFRFGGTMGRKDCKSVGCSPPVALPSAKGQPARFLVPSGAQGYLFLGRALRFSRVQEDSVVSQPVKRQISATCGRGVRWGTGPSWGGWSRGWAASWFRANAAARPRRENSIVSPISLSPISPISQYPNILVIETLLPYER